MDMKPGVSYVVPTKADRRRSARIGEYLLSNEINFIYRGFLTPLWNIIPFLVVTGSLLWKGLMAMPVVIDCS